MFVNNKEKLSHLSKILTEKSSPSVLLNLLIYFYSIVFLQQLLSFFCQILIKTELNLANVMLKVVSFFKFLSFLSDFYDP